MHIKYFAWVKDITGKDSEFLNDKTINNLLELKKFLLNKYPNLKKHFDQEIIRFAVNANYELDNVNLNQNDEIAIFPPVSGG
tara:strand:- start:16301 stop:16546 length:246 start_codon:yes stop_codon:yes gene_type:complete